VLLAVRKGDIPGLNGERTDIPQALGHVIQSSLTQNPEERFQTAREMARALASVLRSTTEQADAEPLGQSVKAARVRLGKDAVDSVAGNLKAPTAVPVPQIDGLDDVEKSSEDLSMSDVEVVEAELTQRKKTGESQKAPPKGLFKNEGPSVAMPLTTKKK